MGRQGSGKTSMRSIIFANYLARDTARLSYTIDVAHQHVKFLGNLVLNLWDCGGQDLYMDSYFNSQKDQIFRNVEVLIYLFDIESREHVHDIRYYRFCLEALLQNSKDASVFCLVHKMDLISEDQRDAVFRQKEAELKQVSAPLVPTCYGTSIWDATLYRAWSSIVYSLIPNVKAIERSLEVFCDACDADEVVMFECATFLEISHVTHHNVGTSAVGAIDPQRFEKVSNIIKNFKLKCSKVSTQFTSFQVAWKGKNNTTFRIFVSTFTSTTYVMVVISDPSIEPAATWSNIEAARSHFEKLNGQDTDSSSDAYY